MQKVVNYVILCFFVAGYLFNLLSEVNGQESLNSTTSLNGTHSNLTVVSNATFTNLTVPLNGTIVNSTTLPLNETFVNETVFSNGTIFNVTVISNGTTTVIVPLNTTSNTTEINNLAVTNVTLLDNFAVQNNGNSSNSINLIGPNETYPFQVAIYLNYKNQFLCGGQILTNNLIVTIASCLYYDWGGVLPPVVVDVVAGRNSLLESSYYYFEAERIVFHSLYDDITLENDLALIQLKNVLNFNSIIRNATLVNSTQERSYNRCFTTGWNMVSGTLESISAITIDCSKTYKSKVCALPKFTNDTFCNFVYGSSLVCDGELIGVLSRKPNCNSNSVYGTFEKLSSSLSWLKSNHAFSSAVSIKQNSINRGIFLHSGLVTVSLVVSIVIGMCLHF